MDLEFQLKTMEKDMKGYLLMIKDMVKAFAINKTA